MLINLWVRDKRDGKVHQVGTDVHDSIVGMGKGYPCYYNLQNGDGTPMSGEDESEFGYEWVEPPDVDDYVMVTPSELYLNRELVHKDVLEILKRNYSPEKREEVVQNKLKELFPLDDSLGGLVDD